MTSLGLHSPSNAYNQDHYELRGIADFGSVSQAAIFSNQTGASKWLKVGSRFESITVQTIDVDGNSIEVLGSEGIRELSFEPEGASLAIYSDLQVGERKKPYSSVPAAIATEMSPAQLVEFLDREGYEVPIYVAEKASEQRRALERQSQARAGHRGATRPSVATSLRPFGSRLPKIQTALSKDEKAKRGRIGYE